MIEQDAWAGRGHFMEKSILLISPPPSEKERDKGLYEGREMGLLCVGSALIEAGFDVDIIPSFHSTEDAISKAIKIMKEKEVGMTAITATTPNYPAAQRILHALKDEDSDLLTVIGGHHVTWLDRDVLEESPFIDVVVRGEGERTLSELAKAKGKNDFRKIKGITYRTGPGISGIARNEGRPPNGDMERVSTDLLDRYLKDVKKRFRNIKIFVEASRGCVYNCLYCEEHDFFGHAIRYKDIGWLFEEFDTIISNFRNPVMYFSDSTFTFNKEFVKKMASRMIERKFAGTFEFHTRVDSYDKETAGMLRKASFSSVYFGIEHLHPEVRKVIRKFFSFRDVVAALRNAKSVGQETLSSWIVGLPGDNAQRSLYSLNGLKLLFKRGLMDASESTIFVPYPGTEPFSNPSKFGLRILTKDWSKYQRIGKPIISYDSFPSDEISMMYSRYRQLPERE